MTATRLTLARHHTATGPAPQPVLVFAAVALPVGWVLLSVPVVLGLPQEPFVLAALLLGLILPALVLTARESGRAGVRALLRDAVRLPRPLWWGPVAALALPAVVWTVALIGGGARPLSLSLLFDAAFALVLSAVVINIWEEMVWTGFVQRRLTAHGGELRGSTLTAFLFAGIHLPLAFDGARGPGDVLLGVTVLIGTGLGLRLLISRLDRWSGRSLLTVGLLHAGFNTGADLVEPGYDWVRIVVTVLLGVAVLALRRRSMSPA